MDNILNKKPGSAAEWCDLGSLYRREGKFGEAVNAFRKAAAIASEEAESGVISIEERDAICSRAEASVELIARITGFVNKDLMNP